MNPHRCRSSRNPQHTVPRACFLWVRGSFVCPCNPDPSTNAPPDALGLLPIARSRRFITLLTCEIEIGHAWHYGMVAAGPL